MKYVQVLILLLILVFMSGCYTTHYLIISQKIPRRASDFESYQKKINGKPISNAQKLKDIEDCGAEPNKYGNFIHEMADKAMEGMSTRTREDINRRDYVGYITRRDFRVCMMNKGYHRFPWYDKNGNLTDDPRGLPAKPRE